MQRYTFEIIYSKEVDISLDRAVAYASLTMGALRRAPRGDPEEAAEGRASLKATERLGTVIVKTSRGGSKNGK